MKRVRNALQVVTCTVYSGWQSRVREVGHICASWAGSAVGLSAGENISDVYRDALEAFGECLLRNLYIDTEYGEIDRMLDGEILILPDPMLQGVETGLRALNGDEGGNSTSQVEQDRIVQML